VFRLPDPVAGVRFRGYRGEIDFPGLVAAYNGARMALEWEPKKWARLSTAPASPSLAQGLANIIRRPATLRYVNEQGESVWEWRLEDADKRWQELQGKAAFHSPERLDRSN